MPAGPPPTLKRLLARLIAFRLFLPLLTITVLALGLGAYPVIRNIGQQQLQLTRSLSHAVDDYLEQTRRTLVTLAALVDGAPSADIRRALDATWRGYGSFDALSYLSAEGRILELVPESAGYQGLDMSRQSYFQTARQGEVTISKPFISPRTGQPTVYLALRQAGGEVLVGELSLAGLQQAVVAAAGATDQRTIFIADEVGTVLAHPDQALVAQQANVGNLTIARRGLTEDTTLFYAAPAGLVLGSATPLRQERWVVVAEAPLLIAFGPIAAVVALTFLLSVCAWLLIAWQLQRQFDRHVNGPLIRLGQGAAALAEGDFAGEGPAGDSAAGPGALAEIADLGAVFQRMRRAIQSRQEDLLASERRLRLILEHMPVMLDAFDDEGRVLFWNRECERVTGYAAAELIGDAGALEKLYPDPGQRAELLAEWTGPAERGPGSERQITGKDGRQRTVAWFTIAHEHPVPGWAHWGIGVDVTERKRLEEQLLQAQKMEAVGQLAGGIAHDFNNLLTVILGYVDLALFELEPADPARSSVEEIQRASQRAARLTQQLLAFSRRQVLKPRVVDLNQAVAELQSMLGRLIGEQIDLRLVAGAGLRPIFVDPGQIEQVLMNLAVNARDAMPRGGRLVIETRDAEIAGEGGPAPPGSWVVLAVTDTGVGMDEATQARLFEPFFTTKEKGRGTGLGLATTHGIVSQSGGHINVRSAPEQGSTFEVYLPPAAAGADARGSAPGQLPAQRREPADRLASLATILLVEDEAMVRELARRALEQQGYRVLQADS
ncbi:MAG TPA: ATP-binding protein, partial [Herpetosiphonaceae bacterium]